MKVQRVCLPDTNRVTWLVLDDLYTPIQPILTYLKFLHNLDRSPNTIRATAHHLKQFWEYLQDAHLCWTEIDIAQLAGFISWLRRLDPSVLSIERNPLGAPMPPLTKPSGLFKASMCFTPAWGRFLSCLCTSSPCRIAEHTNPCCMGLPKRSRSPHVLSRLNGNGAYQRP